MDRIDFLRVFEMTERNFGGSRATSRHSSRGNTTAEVAEVDRLSLEGAPDVGDRSGRSVIGPRTTSEPMRQN